MEFKRQRVNAHNNWPKQSEFKAETDFIARLEAKSDLPFEPISIGYDDDPDYQRCVGHFLDGFDAMPRRPDYLFDHSFRALDLAGSALFPAKGIKGIVQGLGGVLLRSGQADWEAMTDALCQATPLRTCELIAKRILSATDTNNQDHTALIARSKNCLGVQFYSDFMSKYTTPGQTAVGAETIQKAGSFLKLYLSGKQGTRNKTATHAALDLTKAANVPSYNQRIELMLSILLFTLRNERAHGNAISPFRSSKATIERFQSYYFIMLASYVFALGALQLRGWGGINSAAIRIGCERNVALQQAFFT
jgi:hypothetical protein